MQDVVDDLGGCVMQKYLSDSNNEETKQLQPFEDNINGMSKKAFYFQDNFLLLV